MLKVNIFAYPKPYNRQKVEFKKTILGDTVYKYGRVISAVKDKTTSRSSSGSTASGSTRTSGQPPKNGYKSSGPQSGNVRDLLDLQTNGPGTPGQKIHADGPYIYKIIGDNPQSKNTPNVFIKPLSAAGGKGTTNKIFISSGNGYTDCTCYFDDPNDAQAFLDKIIAGKGELEDLDRLEELSVLRFLEYNRYVSI